MNRLTSHMLRPAARLCAVSAIVMLLAACGPDAEQATYQPDRDTSVVPPKPMGGGSDAGLVAIDAAAHHVRQAHDEQ